MATTPFTEALARAAQLHESTQALANELRVPEKTLLRWMSGRAHIPVRALHHLISLLVAHEQRTGPVAEDGLATRVTISLGEVLVRCPRCGAVDFNAPGSQLRMTSVLVCASCQAPATHAELLAVLASSFMSHGRARASRPKRASLPLPATRP
jgi:hypothetical protein